MEHVAVVRRELGAMEEAIKNAMEHAERELKAGREARGAMERAAMELTMKTLRKNLAAAMVD